MTTSADILAPGRPRRDRSSGSRPALEHLDYLLPNDEQVLALHRRGRPRGGAAGRCVERGVGCVAATCGADGVLIVDADGAERGAGVRRSTSSTPPAAATRSAPASCAASRSAARARDAAMLGCATAALVAQGLGTDHGDFDLDAVDAFAGSRA